MIYTIFDYGTHPIRPPRFAALRPDTNAVAKDAVTISGDRVPVVYFMCVYFMCVCVENGIKQERTKHIRNHTLTTR
mgnify:CR=1 FL=1